MIKSCFRALFCTKPRRRLAGSVIAFCVIVLGVDIAFPPPIKSIPTGRVVTDYQGRWLNAFPIDDPPRAGTWRFRADLDEIDTAFIERLVLIEDKRFWTHPGVDIIAILRASLASLRARKVVSGASTITMQTARLLEPRPRTFRSKLIEMGRALQLERRFSKREILSLYLTLAPYGGNIEGVRAASLFYFGKEPRYLSLSQQALLICLPQAPEARRPDAKNGHKGAQSGRALVLDKLIGAGHISRRKAQEALDQKIPVKRQKLHRLAWHETFAQSRKSGNIPEISLTIDLDIQRRLERIITNAFDKEGRSTNFATLVIDNKTRALRGSIGSASLALEGGWLDMTQALRSPGSTLKPFIYAVAFEAGYADEKTLLEDTAHSFNGYSPENFTRVFHGDVTVSEALQHSLNVPAVLALNHIGVARFVGILRATGVRVKAPNVRTRAGLAVALGGVGVTARDLGRLYAALADDGRVKRIRTRTDQPSHAGYRLIGRDHRQKLAHIMANAPSVSGRMPATLAIKAPEVAFKTGTSYGFRDAWAAGYTDRYTVLVWSGHANGTPRPGKTGRLVALPVLFEIFDELQTLEPAYFLPLKTVSDKRTRKRIRKGGARFFRKNARTNKRLESVRDSVTPEQTLENIRQKKREEKFETGSGLGYFNASKASLPPEIIFPQDGVELFSARFTSNIARKSHNLEQVHDGYALAARGGSGGYQWYVDGAKLTKHSDGRFWWFPKGEGFYEISVVDTRGARSQARVFVRL